MEDGSPKSSFAGRGGGAYDGRLQIKVDPPSLLVAASPQKSEISKPTWAFAPFLLTTHKPTGPELSPSSLRKPHSLLIPDPRLLRCSSLHPLYPVLLFILFILFFSASSSQHLLHHLHLLVSYIFNIRHGALPFPLVLVSPRFPVSEELQNKKLDRVTTMI
jgi:hypothetical protein